MEILLAEDDAVSRRILHSYLERWGYDVLVAEDGAKAYQALDREDRPALAILDWMMPGMDGLEVCRRVRQSRFTRLADGLSCISDLPRSNPEFRCVRQAWPA